MKHEDDIGTIRWWGKSWNAPVNHPLAEIPVPVGDSCARCNRTIVDGDQGITVPHMPFPPDTRTTSSWHFKCWMHEIVGEELDLER